MSPRLGFAFVPTIAPERLPELARLTEQHLDELWVWEDCFKQSGLASAVAALACTRELTVGIGLMPVPLRAVSLMAMEIATVHRMFPGRFIPALGHGVQPWMAQAGVRVSSPLTLLEEYVTALRGLLNGEKVSVAGRYVQLEDVQLHWPADPSYPLALGGEGPKTLAMSGRLGDQILLSAAVSESEITAAHDVALAQWCLRDDAPPTMPVVHCLITATGPGARERAEVELRTWGKPGVEDRCAVGDAAEIAAAIRRCVNAGATTIVIEPMLDETDPAGLIRFIGEQVKPLLSE